MPHFGIYTYIKRIAKRILSSKIDSLYWRKKYKNKETEIIEEFESKNYRNYFLDKIKEDSFSTALEIGANWGPNLQMIADKLLTKIS